MGDYQGTDQQVVLQTISPIEPPAFTLHSFVLQANVSVTRSVAVLGWRTLP